ncbi:MAG: right-handed parallel beta-helix repeat-containing protein [Planctomycetes bacterium]|nr:right-handed parallel beta-helix repeat-containing protein [Planctomycetota bacterium]
MSGAELAITDDLIITGPGANLLTIDGNLGSRVFNISASHTAEISGITLTRGATTAGAIRNDGSLEVADCILSGNTAGAISNVGIMTISNSTLANNSAENGGAIATNGTLTVANCTFSGNSAVNVGGAIENQGAAITTITGSSFTGNSAPSGAAIANANRLTVISSTISANQGIGIHTYTGSGTVTEVIDSTINGNAGNGIFNETGSLTVTRSTISGNQSPTGGGIFVRGNLNMVNSTVSGNSTTGGGGGGLVIQGSNNFITNSTITNNSAGFSGGMHIDSNVSLKNTIVAGNTAGSGDPNLNSNYVETGPNILSGNALLGLLQGNGGPTKTHALLSGSPAIDAGINTGAPATDQRGVSRPKGSAVDIGAFEVDPDVTTPTAALASAPTVTAANAAGNNPYLFTVTFSDNTAIDVSTLDNSDVMVSGPNSFNQAATFVSVSPSGNGTPRIATYRVTKAWLPGDNGTYTVALQSNQVKDTAGNAAAGGALGTFLVDLTAPVAALTHPPTVNIANAAGNNPYVFTVTFSDNTAIDVGTLGDSDIDVTGPNSFNQAATFDSVDVSTDGTPRVVRYRFAKTWTAADNGAYTISLQSNQVKDPASNPAAAGSLGTFLVNLTAPTAALASAPNVNAAGNPSNNPYTFMVTFSDDTAIDVGTLDNTDVVVTGPNSFNQAATFVSVSPSGTGTPRTATYQFAKAWSATDTGTYTIALQSNQVKDTAGNPAAAGSLGTFSVLRALFADNFNRNSSPTLGVPWTTPFGAFDVVAPAFDANLAYAHGITLNTNLATLAGLVVADVDLFADVNLATGAQSGLIARFVDFNNYYGATITKEPTGLFTARLVKFVGGGYTELAVFENTAASGKLRLRVFGNTLQMYFNDVLIGAAIDFSLNAGSVGMRTFGNLAQLDNFQVWPITTTIDRVDPFTQPDNTTLSDPWVQSEGYFRTINNRIQGGAAVNRAVIQAAVATDVEVRANIGITGNGHFASLLARYNGATDSWYQGTLVRDTSGTLQAYLFKRSAGVFTQIGGSASLTSVTGNVNARLLVTGGFLKLFINDVLILDGFDPALASGSAGIRSDNYAFFDDFSVRAVRTDLPFSENFNSSALNLPWATQAAPFTLSGGGAAPATGTVSLATLAGVNAANAEVQADIAITNTGGVGSLVLGYNGPGNANYYTAVVYRQPGNIPATPFSLYLFRNDAGNYVQLGAEIKVDTITGPIQFRLAGNQLTFLMNSVVQITAADNTYTGGSVGIRGFVNGANAGTVTIDNFSASNLNFVPFNDSFTAATLDPNWQIRAGGFTSTAAGNVGKAKGTTASNHMTLGRLDLADVDVNATINVPNISGNYVNLTVRVSSGADPDFYLASVYWTGSQFNADIFKKIGATFVQLGTSTIGSGAGVLRFTAVGGQLKLYFGGVAKLSVVDFSLRSGSVGVRSPLDPTFDDFTVAQG